MKTPGFENLGDGNWKLMGSAGRSAGRMGSMIAESRQPRCFLCRKCAEKWSSVAAMQKMLEGVSNRLSKD